MSRAAYKPNPVRVFFGLDCLAGLADEADRLGIDRSVVICSTNRTDVAEALATRLPQGHAVVCEAARPNFPESAFDQVVDAIGNFGADGFIALGGGTAIGLGKAVAAASRLPFIAVPTTYSGSELASNWYVGSGAEKRQGNDAHALPSAVFYDPSLTIGLSGSVSAASGMNAMAHAVESLYGVGLNPVVALIAQDAVRLLGTNLPLCVACPDDLEARSGALKGAWFAAGFRARGGLSHSMAHFIRDAFDLDHAGTHAVTLPYAVAFNSRAAPDAVGAIAEALHVGDAAQGLYDLNRRLGLATGYRDLGMPYDGIDRAVDLIAAIDIADPRPISREQARLLVDAAWRGDPPSYF